jgi:hypothetical protein
MHASIHPYIDNDRDVTTGAGKSKQDSDHELDPDALLAKVAQIPRA